jgi:hypothetical protein
VALGAGLSQAKMKIYNKNLKKVPLKIEVGEQEI